LCTHKHICPISADCVQGYNNQIGPQARIAFIWRKAMTNAQCSMLNALRIGRTIKGGASVARKLTAKQGTQPGKAKDPVRAKA
jgi:hypothetical protein